MASSNLSDGTLRVLVVGAGIGGLTAALALRRQGHQVLIFERSKFNSEVGAAIHIAPNSTRILRRLGMEPLKHGGTNLQEVRMYDGQGQFRKKIPIVLPENNEWYLIHRAGLHSAIKSLAISDDGEGPPARLFLGCDIIELDKSHPSITLRGGEKYSGDLIVGADGVNSWTRSYIAPDAKPYSTGVCCYRWMRPWDSFSKDPLTEEYGRCEGAFLEWLEGDKRLVCYPCDDHKTANIAAFVPSAEVEGRKYGWDGEASKTAMLKSFKDWSMGPRRILEQAKEDFKVWELMDMKNLDTWTSDRLVLLGDAAHPFLPYAGQGGAMAIEDGVCLGALLPRGSISPDEISERLQWFEKCRRERVERVLAYTRRNGNDPNDPIEPRPSPEESAKMIEYCNNHDEWESATTKLEKFKAGELVQAF